MSECIPWMKAISTAGYGAVRVGGKTMSAHRHLYEQAHGPIPKGMIVGHLCHDADESCAGGPTCPHRRCVNLEHLAIQTYSENALGAARNMNRSRQLTGRKVERKTYCKRGHYCPPEMRNRDNSCPSCKLVTARARYARNKAG